ncbi:MAG: hypothetical protein KJ950_14105 [Proteobacteria bacterium]|nr:hypothetical protein [Pseudomonadota bacterium]MBU1686674.1 hypothetical protein [Pseudomonadota bacterium]
MIIDPARAALQYSQSKNQAVSSSFDSAFGRDDLDTEPDRDNNAGPAVISEISASSLKSARAVKEPEKTPEPREQPQKESTSSDSNYKSVDVVV